MTGEPWKASIARLSESVYRLALALHDSRPGAEAATRAALRTVPLDTPTATAEDTLLRALLAQPSRRRWRRAVLPRSLRRIDPRDRFILGAWLLRQIDGPRLAAITGESPIAIVQRLAPLIEQTLPNGESFPDDSRAHPTLPQWLAAQLGIAALPEHPLLCARCHAQQRRWTDAIAIWRARLQDALGRESLPATIAAALSDQVTQEVEFGQAWRRPVVLGTLGVVALLLLALLAPGSAGRGSMASQRPVRELVSDALGAWSSLPERGTLYRQVWARSARGDGSPMVTDVWLSDAATGQHRITVQRDNRLVEWQILVGNRLYYGAEPEHSSCQWNTGWAGNRFLLERGALAFELDRADARAVTIARLEQGAFGLGYAVLRAAHTAADLRSFGVRVEGERTLAVIGYTDRQSDPPRQLLLWIDPATDQLHRVQEVTRAGGQATTRDLWRLEKIQHYATGVPVALPRWPRGEARDRLLDPACPSLRLEHVVSLRALLATPWQWYVPRTLPSGVTQAVLTSPTPLDGSRFGSERGLSGDSRIMFVGPGRHLSISGANWQPNASASDEIERGAWRVQFLSPGRDDTRRLVLRRASAGDQQYVPTIEIWARGFDEEALFELIDSLAPVASDNWRELNRLFLDPHPLAADVAAALERALIATEPQPGITIHTIARTSVRMLPTRDSRADPYHVPSRLIRPETLIREQWLRQDASGAVAVRDQQTLPDGMLYQLFVNDGAAFYWYNGVEGRAWTGPADYVAGMWRPQQAAQHELISLMIDAAPIRLEARGELLLLEQSLTRPAESLWNDWWGPVAPQRPDLAGLEAGSLIRRLWLDARTAQPVRADVIHRSSAGIETPLATTIIEQQRAIEAVDIFGPPMLPDDTLTLQVSADGREAALIDGTPLVISRVLAWTDDPGMVVLRTVPPDPTLSSEMLPAVRWDNLAAVPVAHVTHYELWSATTNAPVSSITVTQGPRALLRHLLRYRLPTTTPSASGDHWTSSRKLSLMISDAPRDVWLLEDAHLSVVVFETDELLVHITGPRDYLRGPLLERLSALTWVDPRRIVGRFPIGPRDRIVVMP